MKMLKEVLQLALIYLFCFLKGQAQVFTAQAQVVHVGGQKFVITPAQVQVQGSGQVIQAQLVQTTTPQGTTIQRLVLTPNAQNQGLSTSVIDSDF